MWLSQGVCIHGLQSEHDELEAKFHEERAALEAKYQKLYEPLYVKVALFPWRNYNAV
jgi:hypothetical protein